MQDTLTFDFSKSQGQSLIVHSVRLIFLALVLVITIVFQMLESRIVSFEAFFPIYIVVSVSFFLQCLYFLFFKKIHRNQVISASMFVLEAIYITLLIYYIGVQQSLLIFLFLVNIILCGILFQRRGALALALLTSVLFSFMLSLDPGVQGHTAFLAVGVNNLAFFTVAYLSGFLSEQLNVMGTQLRERGEDIRALRNLNALILSNMNSGLLTMDQNGIVIQANRLAKKVFSLPENAIVGQRISQLFTKYSLDFFWNRSDSSFDYKLGEGDSAKQLRLHLAKLKEQEQGEARGYILTFQDETKLRLLESRVRQSEKLAAIGQLAAGIAHEIRNPLASISGSVQLMQDTDNQTPENKKLMAIVSREINRLNGLITEFLDYAKPEAPKEDHVDIGALVQEIVEFTSHNNQEIQVQQEIIIKGQPIVIGNRDKLQQAFMNIIVNAYQAMRKIAEPKILVRVEPTPDGCEVSLQDNGCGMDEELVKRIFEPFLTTKHKGTGLGLAITHSIFQSHKAEIQVFSEIDKGTTFKILFPSSG